MGWFDKRTDEEREADDTTQREAEASLAAIRSGGIPLKAQRRLSELKDGGQSFFTSDLSVSEFLLSKKAGLTPLTQVMGSSIYHVGWQPTPGYYSNNWWQSGAISQELSVVSQAWNEARSLAFGRLAQEAELVGAHAVVGVQLLKTWHDWAAGGIEFVAVGTAVRVDGQPPATKPMITDLSVQDFWKLWVAGYEPIGVVGGSGVFYIVPSYRTQRAQNGGFFGGGWVNQELREFTQGVYDAREVTLGRVTREANLLHATGVVGVDIQQTERIHEVDTGNSTHRDDLIVTFHALGTAIRERKDGGRQIPASTTIALNRS